MNSFAFFSSSSQFAAETTRLFFYPRSREKIVFVIFGCLHSPIFVVHPSHMIGGPHFDETFRALRSPITGSSAEYEGHRPASQAPSDTLSTSTSVRTAAPYHPLRPGLGPLRPHVACFFRLFWFCFLQITFTQSACSPSSSNYCHFFFFFH
jgi:hypothetical protein